MLKLMSAVVRMLMEQLNVVMTSSSTKLAPANNLGGGTTSMSGGGITVSGGGREIRGLVKLEGGGQIRGVGVRFGIKLDQVGT